MTFVLTEASRARWSAWPDDRFPDFRTAEGGVLMAELPRAGAGLHTLCCNCWNARWVGGREICRQWPEWLMRPQMDWARFLHCQHCGGRRFALHPADDPGAGGFQISTQDTAAVVSARRLSAWLEGTGMALEEIAGRLWYMPNKAELDTLGL